MRSRVNKDRTTVPTTQLGSGIVVQLEQQKQVEGASSPSWGWTKVALCTHSLNQAVTQSVSPSVSQSSVWQKPKLTMSKATSHKKKGSIVEFDFRLLLLLLFLLSPYFCSPFCFFCCVSILKAWHHSGGEYAECVIKLAALQLTQLISCRRKADCMRIITILH